MSLFPFFQRVELGGLPISAHTFEAMAVTSDCYALGCPTATTRLANELAAAHKALGHWRRRRRRATPNDAHATHDANNAIPFSHIISITVIQCFTTKDEPLGSTPLNPPLCPTVVCQLGMNPSRSLLPGLGAEPAEPASSPEKTSQSSTLITST